jgi:dienelactone hydrolase
MRSLVYALLLAAFAGAASAAIVTKTVEYKAADTTLLGYLAYDDTITSRVPGVLIVPEWWGLNDYAKRRAREIAALGYVALAADMYGEGKITTDPKVAGSWAGAVKGSALIRTRSLAGLETLAAQKNVDAGKLAAIGYCFGGTTVLELAYSGAPVRGVISFHGSLTAPKPEDPKPIKSKVLILHGAADTFESREEIAKVQDGLDAANAQWEMDYYSGAVHAFTNPDADKAGIPGVAYNAIADRRSWQRMQSFLVEIFK